MYASQPEVQSVLWEPASRQQQTQRQYDFPLDDGTHKSVFTESTLVETGIVIYGEGLWAAGDALVAVL